MKRLLLVIGIASIIFDIKAYIISNGGSKGQYMAVYDSAAGTSALIDGYSDPNIDNGHCVAGKFVPGQKITIIIPENLAKFGLVSNSCICSASSSSSTSSLANCTNFNTACPTFSGVAIINGLPITTQTQIGSNCTPSSGPCQSPSILQINNGVPQCCTILYSNSTITPHVSPLCQEVEKYIVDNFADINKDLQTAEYAPSSLGETSYCSITFVPKRDFKLRINTDILMASSHWVPGICGIQLDQDNNIITDSNGNNKYTTDSNGNISCFFSTKNSTPNQCLFKIDGDDSPGSGGLLGVLNNWLQANASNLQSGSVLPPQAYFTNCTNNAQIMQYLENQAMPNFVDMMWRNINARLRLNGLPITLPVPRPATLTPEQQVIDKKYLKAMRIPSLRTKYRKIYMQNMEFQSKLQSTNLVAQAEKGLPCIGSSILNADGSVSIVYTCSTYGYNPNYTCNVQYQAPSVNGQFSYLTSSCSFPLTSFAMQSPTLGDPDFYCGYCTVAETNTVGGNSLKIGIESGSYGTLGEIYPFDSGAGKKPSCCNGFIAWLGDIGPESNYATELS